MSPIGTAENPYDLVLPGWLEDLYMEQSGETVQEAADRVFLPHVKVRVIR